MELISLPTPAFWAASIQGSLSKTGTGVMSIRNTNLNNLSLASLFSGGVLSVGAKPNVLPTNFARIFPRECFSNSTPIRRRSPR